MLKFSPIQKSYLTQYISLMLIILSCLIGSSISKQPAKVNLKQEESAIAVSNRSLKSEISFDNIFISGTNSINISELEPLKQLLENHNLDLVLSVSAKNGIGTKVAQLAKVLRENGFWRNSFTVSGHLEPNIETTKVTAHFEWSQL